MTKISGGWYSDDAVSPLYIDHAELGSFDKDSSWSDAIVDLKMLIWEHIKAEDIQEKMVNLISIMEENR